MNINRFDQRVINNCPIRELRSPATAIGIYAHLLIGSMPSPVQSRFTKNVNQLANIVFDNSPSLAHESGTIISKVGILAEDINNLLQYALDVDLEVHSSISSAICRILAIVQYNDCGMTVLEINEQLDIVARFKAMVPMVHKLDNYLSTLSMPIKLSRSLSKARSDLLNLVSTNLDTYTTSQANKLTFEVDANLKRICKLLEAFGNRYAHVLVVIYKLSDILHNATKCSTAKDIDLHIKHLLSCKRLNYSDQVLEFEYVSDMKISDLFNVSINSIINLTNSLIDSAIELLDENCEGLLKLHICSSDSGLIINIAVNDKLMIANQVAIDNFICLE